MTVWEWVALALYGVMAGGLLIASVIGWIAWHAKDMCWACYGRGASNDRDGLCHSCWPYITTPPKPTPCQQRTCHRDAVISVTRRGTGEQAKVCPGCYNQGIAWGWWA